MAFRDGAADMVVDMASTTCGRCGRLAHMSPVSPLHYIEHVYRQGWLEAAYVCPNCRRLNLASSYGASSYGSNRVVLESDSHEWAPGTEWLPRYGEVQHFADVPDHIAQAASEATLCLSVGAYRAVGALARAVIEATAKDKGIATGKLVSKINALEAAGHIRAHTRDVAHEIRHFGNDMAHGDFADPVSKEEAEAVVTLMSEVLDEVFRAPARLDRVKAARIGKAEPTEPELP
jgi:hypothetical protein